MSTSVGRDILIIGITGSQGSAVARHLLASGMPARGLTRNAASPTARALAARGVTMVTGNLDDAVSLERALEGVRGVYLVTEFFKNGIAGEIRHGKAVADAAKRMGVAHLVHASVSGADRRSGVPHFDSKAEIEAHIRAIGVPATILRPTVFMEDLTEQQYVPPASWGMMPKLVGADRPVKWITTDDIGAAAAAVFARTDEFVGKALPLVGDVLSIRQAREVFRRVDGRTPFALPMPTMLFRRFVSDDLVRMWEWLAQHDMDGDVSATRALIPGVRSMETWLRAKRTQA